MMSTLFLLFYQHFCVVFLTHLHINYNTNVFTCQHFFITFLNYFFLLTSQLIWYIKYTIYMLLCQHIFITFLNFIFIKCVDKLTKICYNKGLRCRGWGLKCFVWWWRLWGLRILLKTSIISLHKKST